MSNSILVIAGRVRVTNSVISMCVLSLVLLASTSVQAAGRQSNSSGVASVYGYTGGRTASGERARPNGMTAAHRSLPFGTNVQVTNRRNGRSAVVRINDRGPFVRGRVIDVTPAAARVLGFSGLTQVSLAVLR